MICKLAARPLNWIVNQSQRTTRTPYVTRISVNKDEKKNIRKGHQKILLILQVKNSTLKQT